MAIPKSFIKEVAIEINLDYDFDNSPHNSFNRNKEKLFLGRDKNLYKLSEFLKNERGVYLVTGYRGMGKTSFVNRAIDNFEVENARKSGNKKTDNTKVERVNINLNQSELKEFDTLRLMVFQVYDKYKRHKKITKKLYFINAFTWFLNIGMLLFIAGFVAFLFKENDIIRFLENPTFSFSTTPQKGADILKFILYLLIVVIIVLALFRHFLHKPPLENYRRIQKLVTRCSANVVKEESNTTEAVLEAINTKISGPGNKETLNYPIASAKEIEYELSEFLEKVHRSIQFIFIFDELDKVEPAVVSTSYHQETIHFEKANNDEKYLYLIRERKQAVLNLISSLKNFLTTANANFIFIAGREMFDASLADIADRQSSISSMFNYVFYIDSLLKDSTHDSQAASLSILIETYLTKIFSKAEKKEKIKDIINEFKFKSINGKNEVDEAKYKLFVLLQSFIVYLTYRSNGSPKKLIRSIHEFIRILDPNDFTSERVIVASLNNFDNRQAKHNGNRKHKYLYFNYLDQYRVGFINYLYKPFLIRYGRALKENSDSIIVSTPYLFDHLLKFHPFAFSLQNLELIPEVLSTSKTPTLREHIKTIISYLSHSHIRETEIGLFDYKFFSRTLNELIFISKSFEEEGAAFNFTLDESYLVKLHVRSKIRELRQNYSKFHESANAIVQSTYSIAFLNGILGDLHFFDEEYDDAIIAYSDAIKPINNLEVDVMNMRDFILLIKNKLKIGLSFEKISSYEESLAFYTDASNDAKRFIKYILENGQYIKKYAQINKDIKEKPDVFLSSSLNDLLQILNQSFMAKLMVQEKLGIEGITANKIAMSLGSFLKLSENIALHCGKNHLIHANFYLTLANILYFKNENETSHEILNRDVKLPDPELKLFNLLRKKFTFGNANTGERKPLLPIYFYTIGILEVLETKAYKEGDSYFGLNKHLIDKINAAENVNLLEAIYTTLADESIKENKQFSKYHFKYFATFLSCIGDCLLGMYKSNGTSTSHNTQNDERVAGRMDDLTNIFDKEKVEAYLTSPQNKFSDYLKPFTPVDGIHSIADVLKYFYLSAEYYKKRGRNLSAGFQFRKILYVLKLVLSEDIHQQKTANELFFKNVVQLIEDKILHEILVLNTINSEFGDRHSQLKYGQVITDNKAYIKNNLSSHPENRESIILLSYVKLKILGETHEELISSYNSISTQFSRLLEIEYYAKCCRFNIPRTYDATISLSDSQKEYLTNYIYSLIAVIRILNVYGSDYMIGFCFKGYFHFQLANILDNYSDYLKEENAVDKLLKGIVSINLGTSDAIYHYQMAKHNYEKVLQLHNLGAEYRNALDKILYLEDDVHDNAAHFGAAMERYHIMNDTVKNYIQKCIDRLNHNKYAHEWTYKAFIEK